MTKCLSLAVAGTLLLPAVSAHATLPSAPLHGGRPLMTISVAGLDLATRHGQHRFKHRIADAIEAVCGSYAQATSQEQEEIASCRRGAMADIAPRLEAVLTAHGLPRSAVQITRSA